MISYPFKPLIKFLETWRSQGWVTTRQMYSNLVATLRLAWQASSGATLGMFLGALVLGFIPIGQAWIGKTIVDQVAIALTLKIFCFRKLITFRCERKRSRITTVA